jgi:hypothetical protein
MDSVPVNKFLVSLMAAIEARPRIVAAGLVWVTSDPTEARSLWLNEIDARGGCAGDPATVLRSYGGASPAGWVRNLAISLQAMTRGGQAAATLDQAWQVAEAMLADDGRPMTHWRIAGKVLAQAEEGAGAGWSLADDPDQDWEVKQLLPLGSPGLVGRDAADNKWMASCNWDVTFRRIAK